MFSYYVYYRVSSRHDAEAATAVAQMQFELERETGVPGRLLRKRDAPLLWMEIYENVAASEIFEAKLIELSEKTGLSRLLEDGCIRNVECFQG